MTDRIFNPELRRTSMPSSHHPVHAAGSRPKFKVVDYAIIAAIVYPTAINSVAAFLELDSAVVAILYAAAVIIVTGLLIFAGSRKRERIKSPPIGIMLALFLLLSALSTFLAETNHLRYDGPAMWRQFAVAMLPVFLFWGAKAWASRDFNLRALDLGFAFLVGICAASIFLDYFGIIVFESYGNRHFGFLGDAAAWVATLPAIYFIARGRLALFGLCLLILLVTQTRSALLVFGAAIILYFLLSRINTGRARMVKVAGAIASVFAMLVGQSFVGQILERFQGTDLIANDRTRTIEFTLEVFWYRPLMGSGYNAHFYFIQPYQAIMGNGDSMLGTAVSTPLQVLADAGLVGFVPFMLALMLICWLAFRAIRLPAGEGDAQALMGLGAWLIAFLVLNQTAAWLVPLSILPSMVFVAAGILAGRLGRSDAVSLRRSQQAEAAWA